MVAATEELLRLHGRTAQREEPHDEGQGDRSRIVGILTWLAGPRRPQSVINVVAVSACGESPHKAYARATTP
ncbi:uncharacterized protein G2W53_040988 [Senna tora]|uniref:Uncharacterized protein n=1 Tax=Senna tora TaxID=362788 RepID=A0A834VYC9_9FABA|nr:uncharacterized protein G2W53_040988 [Senna tora]